MHSELRFSTDQKLARLRVIFEMQVPPTLAITFLHSLVHTEPPALAAPATRFVQVVGPTDAAVPVPEALNVFPRVVHPTAPVELFSQYPR